MIYLFTYTNEGSGLAEKLSVELPPSIQLPKPENSQLQNAWQQHNLLVFISATGIAVRKIALLLRHKATDPAVVVIDDRGRFVISLVGGHLGGANEWTNRLAAILQAVPVITTASESREMEPFDLFAQKNGLVIDSFADLTAVTTLAVNGEPLLYQGTEVLRPRYHNWQATDYRGCLAVSWQESLNLPVNTAYLRPRVLNLGIGFKKGKSSQELYDVVQQCLAVHNLAIKAVAAVASIDFKAADAEFIALAQRLQCPVYSFSAAELAACAKGCKNSGFVAKTVQTPAVSAPAARLLGGELIVDKFVFDGVTVSVSVLQRWEG